MKQNSGFLRRQHHRKMAVPYSLLFFYLLLLQLAVSDIHTKSGLNRLYNEKVVKAERMQRPMSSSGKGLPVPHQGVRLLR